MSEIVQDFEREELDLPLGATEYRTVYRRGKQRFVTRLDRLTVDRKGHEWRLRAEQEILERMVARNPHGPVIVDMSGAPMIDEVPK